MSIVGGAGLVPNGTEDAQCGCVHCSLRYTLFGGVGSKDGERSLDWELVGFGLKVEGGWRWRLIVVAICEL